MNKKIKRKIKIGQDIRDKKYQEWFDSKVQTSLKDDLINKFVYLEPYYNQFIGELVAVLPSYSENINYYACPIKIDENSNYQKQVLLDEKIKRLAPAFLYHCPFGTQNDAFNLLHNDENKKFIEKNPYAIIFHGCDDGHVGRRFSNKQDALDFLKSINSFDEFFENSIRLTNKELSFAKKEKLDLSELMQGTIEYRN